HGRRVEAVVHQSLGDIFLTDARGCLERAQIDDAFVGDRAVAAGVQHREVCFQTPRDVVGVEDGDLGSHEHARRSHQTDVGPGDGQDACAAPGGRGDGCVASLWSFQCDHAVVGQERSQVFLDTDGAHAGAAATVGNAEGLVQVHVRDVSADVAGTGQADLCG